VLGGDQLKHRITEVLQALVIGVTPFRMLVVIGAVGQGLPKQGSVVKANAKRALKLLDGVVGRRGL